MKNAAVNFEYEWMPDGSLRLRFLNRANEILGQQIVAAEGLPAFQLLLAMAVAKTADTKPHILLELFQRVGLDADLSDVIALKEAKRVRAGVTPEGDVGLKEIEEE